jgi:CMP-N-acetylneuraminic acid synthetase
MYIRSKGRNFQNIGLYLEHEQTRRQNLPEVFLRDGCYYFIGRELLARGKQVSENPEGLVRKFPWTINLDVQEDYIMAQIVLQNYRSVLERENAI